MCLDLFFFFFSPLWFCHLLSQVSKSPAMIVHLFFSFDSFSFDFIYFEAVIRQICSWLSFPDELHLFKIYLIGRWLLYNIVMLFAIHQHRSATGAHVSPHPDHPSVRPPFPPHPSGLSRSTGFGCPASWIELSLGIYFTYGNRHVSVLLFQIIPSLPSSTESESLFFTSVSLSLHYM